MRKAMSKAINRPAIVDARDGRRGGSRRASSFPISCSARRRTCKVETFDPDGAKKLLAEAGYPNGFGLTHPRAEQSLRQRREDRAGRRADADARRHRHQGRSRCRRRPTFTQATDLKFSSMLVGWSTGTGEASSSLKALLMTYNKDKGFGTRQPRPLLEPQGRRADRGRAADRRRRQARGVPAARDRARDQRHRHHPAALPGEPVGDARRHHLRAARRREDARVEVQPPSDRRGSDGATVRPSRRTNRT